MPPVTLTPIATGFNNPIGIDYHEPTDQVILSVNYPTGQPSNFELVARDGTRQPFTTISGFTDEVKIATVQGGLPSARSSPATASPARSCASPPTGAWCRTRG